MSNEAKKTEAPKSNEAPKAEAFPHTMFSAFDPMQYWTQSQQTFQKLVTETYARAQSFADHYTAIESQMVSRAQSAVASWAQAAQDAIAYTAQLSAEARKIGFENLKKMGQAN